MLFCFQTTTLIFCVFLLVNTESRKIGAPTTACETMTPFHSISRQDNVTLFTPQNTQSPYVLSTNLKIITSSTAVNSVTKNNGNATAEESLVPSIEGTLHLLCFMIRNYFKSLMTVLYM